jgi:hypothetical protein
VHQRFWIPKPKKFQESLMLVVPKCHSTCYKEQGCQNTRNTLQDFFLKVIVHNFGWYLSNWILTFSTYNFIFSYNPSIQFSMLSTIDTLFYHQLFKFELQKISFGLLSQFLKINSNLNTKIWFLEFLAFF